MAFLVKIAKYIVFCMYVPLVLFNMDPGARATMEVAQHFC